MSSKLPRATLAQKLQIIDYYHKSDRPQLETVDKFKNEVSISTSSFSEWLRNEPELRKRYNQADFKFSKNSKRKVKFKYGEINKAMDKLVTGMIERNDPITEPILRQHWAVYAHQFGVDDPKRLHSFSHGWLSQFKKRHGINKKSKNGSQRNTTNGAPRDDNEGASDSIDIQDNAEEENETNSYQPLDDPEVEVPAVENQNYDPKFSSISHEHNIRNPTENNNEPRTKKSRLNGRNNVSQLEANSNYDLLAQQRQHSQPPSLLPSPSPNSDHSHQSQQFMDHRRRKRRQLPQEQQQEQDQQEQPQQAPPPSQQQQTRLQDDQDSENVHRNNQEHYIQHGNSNVRNETQLLQEQQKQLQKSKQQPTGTDTVPRNQFRPQQGLSFSHSNSPIMGFGMDKHNLQLQTQYQKSHRHGVNQTNSISGDIQNPSPEQDFRNSLINNNGNNNTVNYSPNQLYKEQRQLLNDDYSSTITKSNDSRGSRAISTNDGTETEVSTNQALLTGRMPEEETKAASELNNIIHPITATDMERFIYMFADRFFHIHQHEYPQTVKVFQEFKLSFFNERIMNNRTPKQLQQQATISQHSQLQQSQLQQPQQLSPSMQPTYR